MSAPNTRLFYITRFLYSWQKIFTNKKISQNTIYMFCLYPFLLKWIIKKNYLPPYGPLNTLMGRWYHWHCLKVTHWWVTFVASSVDDATCIIHSKIHQKASNSPIVFVFCYIYAQKVVGSNTYAQVTGCPSVSAAPGNWHFYVNSCHVSCYACHCALSPWCLVFSLQDFCQLIT